ncbi:MULTISPECIES: nicotinate-nucleotide--dimethylbenzimidazole phosphoribosyltransferase [unclassified Acinetobacter]|uniref:nicotinate-nucleotide--dimethylbenzimidazole phosphoribosyltransferase n=1 Tax=unclassified Acinetobacter TaxID=196816 RepID=UPI002448772C|nr:MULTISPECIES: nicotinate-nucleotide--dimethylbenzimidazole phosphoribosyltransferase [unclassified Acinetobacter]MDH0030239.1 nicotinate-nucleotide--dimethylbenzimidazole phosphoribosyltransferase [Acinetobacter sp. GD04021]MDH0885807.1 nicotinate-nucleotide--dimethylbenzimidazole phosphoribosyltransferase [Acinetobacter sp. GD03873]MDH1082427.1 nicotinate-nucleotide--dimethylbenzimidazole phosphoribosyltransferase [Acinetobacter sp. GD03983]MDH2189181.1 nicotinate-nucleotide--dimethylbenzim
MAEQAYWWMEAVKQPDLDAKLQAEQRQLQLTKPTGALGDLEQIAITLASLQGTVFPKINKPWISIFAGDHGVVEENISAYPQAVTRQMLQNFASGGAAISVIAKHHQAHLQVIDCGTVGDAYNYTGVERHCIRAGTANFAKQAAMTEQECQAALQLGKNSVDLAKSKGADIFIAGEMGIGNTCSASALACLLLDESAQQLTGVGTGINTEQLQHKINVIDQAVKLHKNDVTNNPLKILAAVGGLEIAAMAGAYLRCAQMGVPIVVDGFISSVAALCAVRIQPQVREWMLFGHQSAEYGHQRILKDLNAQPILNMNLRLGEGSGAGSALSMIQLACVLHNQMATFAEAAVSGDKVG